MQWETIKDILRDPPFARLHKEPMNYGLPRPKIKDLSLDLLDEFKANIVQFYEMNRVSGTLQVKRSIREVIYKAGPAKIMQTGTKMQEAVSNLDGDKSKVESSFTWIHLPATN
ncbi:hypothetical protein COL5a_001893 [Colletotrichum fioriniae]|nr:uncharacterized protein COL516b_001282 [Colletotrichum fioriniae]KAJ0312210.1 hypothetical protein COL516b_001282 [Colletotrichum fioriniae]KAJ0332189.1 hypothetical protein COL5a_001893 [Colletotrichum fioriniae]